MQPNILIAGAGLGGLSLAQSLKRASIPFRIFERDANASWRAQGYRLTLVPDGAAALQSCLPTALWELFEQTAITPTKGLTVFRAVDAQALPTPGGIQRAGAQRGSQNGKSYVVDRTVLRTLLTFGLEEHIEYSKRLERFETNEGGVTAFFQDGTRYSGSLLVAADGANSIVRRQHIPHHLLYDTKLRCIYGKTPVTKELRATYHPEAMEHTTFFNQEDLGLHMLADPVIFKRDPHLIDSRLGHVDDYIFWAFLAKSTVFDLPDDRLLTMTPNEVADLSLSVTSQWYPSIRALLELQDKSQTAVTRMHTSNPSTPYWPPNPHVTFIGDAGHAMLPTGASGARTAFSDAASLSQLLLETKGQTSMAMIAAFEEEMRECGGDRVGFSIQNGMKLFNIPPFEHYTPIRT